MEPNGAEVGGNIAHESIPKSIDRSIPLPIACKCHFEATLEFQKTSKLASILDKSRLSTIATRHGGISEKCAFSPGKRSFFSQRSHGEVRYSAKQTRTKKRSSLGDHKQEELVTPFGIMFAPFVAIWEQNSSKTHVKTTKRRAIITN